MVKVTCQRSPRSPRNKPNYPCHTPSWLEGAPGKLGSAAQTLWQPSFTSAPCSCRSERTFSWHPQASALFKNRCRSRHPPCVTYVTCPCPNQQDHNDWFKHKSIRTTLQTPLVPTSLESFGYCGEDKKLQKNPDSVRKKEVGNEYQVGNQQDLPRGERKTFLICIFLYSLDFYELTLLV